MHAHDEDNIYVNAFNAMKEELKQLKDKKNHRMAKLQDTMSNSDEVETLHDVVTGKNEMIKSLRGIIENLKSQLINRSTLKPSDTHRNLFTRNCNISQLNIEEAIITTPILSQNDHTGQINKRHTQLKEYRGKMHEKYALLRNTQCFGKN